jgi:hypothetical protein
VSEAIARGGGQTGPLLQSILKIATLPALPVLAIDSSSRLSVQGLRPTNARFTLQKAIIVSVGRQSAAGRLVPIVGSRHRPHKSLPVESKPGFSCPMSIIVVRVQVLAGRRDRFMPQVVPQVSQIDLAIHHARACRVPQPMGRRLAQPFCCALVRFARRLQVPDRIVEHLFDDQVHGAARHRPMRATDRQQQWGRFTAIRQRRETIVSGDRGLLDFAAFYDGNARYALRGVALRPYKNIARNQSVAVLPYSRVVGPVFGLKADSRGLTTLKSNVRKHF